MLRLPIILMNQAALPAVVIVDGMMRGVYTGHRLREFVTTGKEDFLGGRRVVNGQDCAQKIADQAAAWLRQL